MDFTGTFGGIFGPFWDSEYILALNACILAHYGNNLKLLVILSLAPCSFPGVTFDWMVYKGLLYHAKCS